MKNRYDSEQTVNDIIDVATKLFTEKGFEKTSIQDIVNGLDGLTRGAIYHHFDSKDEIMVAVIRKRLPYANQYLIDRTDNRKSAYENLRDILIQALSANSDENVSILTNNPRIFMEVARAEIEITGPQLKMLLDAANVEGSITISDTHHVSEVLVLMVSMWYSRVLYPETDKMFDEKLCVLKKVLEGVGLNLLDTTTIDIIKRMRLNNEKNI
ncbi:helix-turn-helix domain containing protein [Erysipelothrix rhusiopathiae]|uniref:TetR/AcrR family transcriptional regulator n=1 Tax=Erysipelothrix rhusiopathiae TaxID=1648 RepID=UPI0023B12C99|nr:TetR/AcrR family transcriptional regulator [Erysipelothrix rhusiopathiae]MDE8339280.1 helix-turn-helix domain containing protein [Erysipelothrix rhusiopathiae]MDE8340704.1 helix-turn-helix domain containing protein [Erysipelothrix rhusiopathiae]